MLLHAAVTLHIVLFCFPSVSLGKGKGKAGVESKDVFTLFCISSKTNGKCSPPF